MATITDSIFMKLNSEELLLINDLYLEMKKYKDIINELEKYLIEKIEYMKSHSIERMITYDDCLDKLKELKGEDNND